MVIFCQRPLTFKNLNCDSFLIILIGSENLWFLSWDVWTFWNNLAHDTTDSFNTKWERSSINDNDSSISRVLSADDTTLNSSTITNSLIRIDTCIWLFSIEKLFYQLSNFRNSSWASNQNYLVDFCLFKIRTFKGELEWL